MKRNKKNKKQKKIKGGKKKNRKPAGFPGQGICWNDEPQESRELIRPEHKAPEMKNGGAQGFYRKKAALPPKPHFFCQRGSSRLPDVLAE